VKVARFLLVMLYVAYMTQVGLLLVVLPWSESWSFLLLLLPPRAAFYLDQPVIRGLLTGIGVLHLLALALELLPEGLRRRFIR
jgi:hypothetical protein